MTVYIDYCSGTKPTALKIKRAIGAEEYTIGTELEPDDIFISWGGKTQVINRHGAAYINSPTSVGANRNKLRALLRLAERDVNVPVIRGILEIESNIQLLPVIARTRHHQGGKGFWYCNSTSDARAATNAGAEFFLEAQRIQEEYRVHVFNERVIHISRKVMHQYPQKAWVKHMMDKNFPDMDWELLMTGNSDAGAEMRIAHKVLTKSARYGGLPDMTCRSNNRGWKFVESEASSEVQSMSIRAVKAMDMDFGAVDLLTTQEFDNAVVLEVNSAPGLDGAVFDRYVSEFLEHIQQLSCPDADRIVEYIENHDVSDDQLREIEAILRG